MTQVNIEVGKVSDLLYDLMTSTKATKFRAGFTKVNGEYRVGKFDLLNRKTWKQTMVLCTNARVRKELLTQTSTY